MKLKDLLFLCFMSVLAGCSSTAVYTHHIIHGTTYHDNVETGGKWLWNYLHEDPYYQTRKEYPQVSINAVGYVDLKGHPTLQVGADILRNSLTFPGGRPATAVLQLHVVSPDGVDTTTRRQLTIAWRADRINYSYQKHLQVPPGKYTVHVQLSDRANGQTTERTARTDSLRFTLRVTNATADSPLALRARLMQFTADSLPAPWNHFYYSHKYRRSSLTFRGIDYTDSMIVHRERRTLTAQGSVEIRFRFQRPPRGNYRFIVQTGQGQLKGRAFAVRSLDFPTVKTPRERAAPLIYLMRRDSLRAASGMKTLLQKATRKGMMLQGHSFSRIKTNTKAYEVLMATFNRDSLRAAVKCFWQSHIADPKKARKAAALYYRRVAAANQLFSNYKEGWKTVRGMIYILFGSPSFIWHVKPLHELPSGHVSEIGWYYRDNGRFTFLNEYFNEYNNPNSWGELRAIGLYQSRSQSRSFPFQQFLLEGRPPGSTPARHVFVELIHYKQRLWLSGDILQEMIYYHGSGIQRVGRCQGSNGSNMQTH
jgi:GWxTD domain-containing protein